MNKSILVLGSAGMAGHVIYKVLKEELKDFRIFDVARDSRFVNPSKCMDIKDFKMLEHYIEELKPAFIINCIGLLNKSAENFPDEAIFSELKAAASFILVLNSNLSKPFSAL